MGDLPLTGLYIAQKKIVYLDQNFLSNFAKAPSKPVLNHYQELSDTLFKLVEANIIACPTSEFHQKESEFAPNLFNAIRSVAVQLSRGLSFRGWLAILESQTVEALYRYLRTELPESMIGWHVSFSEDPDLPIEPYIVDAFYPTPSLFIEEARRLKASHPDRAEKVMRSLRRREINFDQRLEQEVASFIRTIFLEPLERLKRTLVKASLDLPCDELELTCARHVLGVCRAYRELTGETDPFPTAEFFHFFSSQEFRDIPFVHIYCSLHAAMATQEAKPRPSDLEDVLIASTVIPYCNVFATDGHVKDLVQKLKLDDRYNVKVFGARKADVLNLTALIGAL